MAQPITIYGSRTCEDTAVVRDHLDALGIPFSLINREDDPNADAMIRRWNSGNVATPTILFGDPPRAAVSEPSLERLEELVPVSGSSFTQIQAAEFRELANLPAPDFSLPSTDGSRFALGSLRGRRKSVLFFAHDAGCRVCAGYARQLLRHRAAFDEYAARLLLILSADLDVAKRWAEEFVEGYPVLADAGGAIKARYAEYLQQDARGVLLLVLDSYTAPRAGSFGPDAGHLIIPREALEWLRLLDSECPE